MRRKPLNSVARPRLSKYARPLAQIALLLAEAGSRNERRYWKRRLYAALAPLLVGRSDAPLTHTLDHLYDSNGAAYDSLASAIETCVESPCIKDGQELLLIAAPVLAWSNYSIACGRIDTKTVQDLQATLEQHVLAEHVQLVLGDFLFSPDYLPESYIAAAQLSRELAGALLNKESITLAIETLPDMPHFLSDVRYLIGAIAVPEGLPMFKWQEETQVGALSMSREDVLASWKVHGGPQMQKLMPGCALEMLLPNGLYSACRNAESEARSYSVRASIAFISAALNVTPAQIHVSVGCFVDHGEIEEYRLGFSLKNSSDVLHGIVWPLLGDEYGNEPDPVYGDDIADTAELPTMRAKIQGLLKELGVHKIIMLDERFPLEYCEDCGAPVYPNAEGELMHAELPEDADIQDIQLH
ncbi:MAG: DUF2863 family protein [Burkholderiaceae bacterium]